MAVADHVLAHLVTSLRIDLADAGLTRERGGLGRGVAWAEACGRGVNGAWLQLRFHHRRDERRLEAGLLAYEPIAEGGRTVVLGQRSLPYRYDAGEVANHLAEEVTTWLQRISDGLRPRQSLPARLPPQ